MANGALMRWIKRIVLGGGALLLTAAAAGAAYQALATRADARRFPPPGRLVEVDGRKMHLRIRGEGGPTVVFDAPLGASSLGWELIAPKVSALTTTLVFDRAGYGWSDPGPTPRTSERIVADLHALLEASGAPKPYVLVGASFGGCDARLYAFRYPDEVAGLVLVDPAHEDQFARMSADKRPPLFPLRLFQVAARLGVLRLAGMPIDIAGLKVLDATLQPEADAVGFRTDAVDATVDETAALDASFAEIREARAAAGTPPLGDTPLVVLTHATSEPPKGKEADAYAAWVALHEEIAKESTRGRQSIVKPSGHFIAVDQPGAVVDAIGEVVAAVRRSAAEPSGSSPERSGL